MTDDELRQVLAEAHRDDAVPPLGSVLARARSRRRPARRAFFVAAGLAVSAAVLALVLLLRHRAPPPPSVALASVELRWSAPLDFLLDVPGGALLRDTPRFDLKGTWP